MITVAQYKEAMEIIKTCSNQKDAIKEKAQNDSNASFRKFGKLEEELRTKKYKAENKIRKEEKEKLQALDTEMASSIDIRNEHKKIMLLINNHLNIPEYRPVIVYRYNYGTKETFSPIEPLYTNSYTSIYWYIVPNKKPKNKFSIIIVGNTIFNTWTLLSFEASLYDYGVDISHENANIKLAIKDAPTQRELLDYISKHKEKIASKIKMQLDPIEKKYEEAVELFKQKDWQVEYWKHEKDYYENYVSRGTEEPEYQEVLKNLEKLTKK